MKREVDLIMDLLKSQLLALENITKYAKNYSQEAKLTINHILKMIENV